MSPKITKSPRESRGLIWHALSVSRFDFSVFASKLTLGWLGWLLGQLSCYLSSSIKRPVLFVLHLWELTLIIYHAIIESCLIMSWLSGQPVNFLSFSWNGSKYFQTLSFSSILLSPLFDLQWTETWFSDAI